MAQFWVYRNANPVSQATYPYLLDFQSDFLSELRTTVVIPLVPLQPGSAIALARLNPVLPVDADMAVLMTQDMAGVPRALLQESVCDLRAHRADIMAAMDFLVSGI